MATSPSFTDVDYVAGSGTTAAPTERANVFLPSGTAPDDGWPVLLWIEETVLDAGSRQTSIASGDTIASRCLKRGIAFVSATVTRVIATGPDAVDGNGAFQPPGSVRWADADYPSPWKSACHLVQWAKEDAATYGFDPAKVVIGGDRMGADLALWVGLGTDWPAFSGAAQFRSSSTSRPVGVLAQRPTGWFRAVIATKAEPGFASSGDDDTLALRFNQATQTDLDDASPLRVGFDDATYPGVRALNAEQPVFLWAPDAPESADWTKTGTDPTLANTLNVGAAWGARMLRRELVGLGSAARAFHFRSSGLLQEVPYQDTGDPTGASVANSYPSELVAKEAEFPDRASDWLGGVFSQRPPIDPVQERIVRNIQALLAQPRVGASYFGSIWSVKRGPHLLAEGKTQLPAVVVTSLGYSTDGPGREQTNTQSKVLRLEIVGATKTTSTESTTHLEYLAHDIEWALYQDRTCGGLATDLVVSDATFAFPADDQTAISAVIFDVDVTFRTPSTDLLTHK